MAFANQYLIRNRFTALIPGKSSQQPGISVVIPCYNEPSLLRSLQSLYQCKKPTCLTEVIVVINHPEYAPEKAKKKNEQTLHEILPWIKEHNTDRLQFHAIYLPDLQAKTAGVGLARKAGMDEAVYRFNSYDASNGIITGFDADSTCDENYLEEIERKFSNGSINGASVYYEHPLTGEEYPHQIYAGIVLYELHLRYLNQALRYAGFPYAFHTVGSSFAVRALAYVKQGGMNRRKAGEDFHFLHKIIPLGNYAEINTTRVIPSPRISDRVPFGTGASIRHWMNDGEQALFTYPIEPFEDLKKLFSFAPDFYQATQENITHICSSLPDPLHHYLLQNDYLKHISIANANSASVQTFAKRFLEWFDALQIVKYLNFSCQDDYAKQPADIASARLLQILGHSCQSKKAEDLLLYYRNMERNGTFDCA